MCVCVLPACTCMYTHVPSMELRTVVSHHVGTAQQGQPGLLLLSLPPRPQVMTSKCSAWNLGPHSWQRVYFRVSLFEMICRSHT